mmetsp:Transcript_96772/g.235240  ORF Transcript_96772/g.235240 Transcript_96772/m.235240 type:complete len:145 (-) Transcript_96772:143-577(-)
MAGRVMLTVLCSLVLLRSASSHALEKSNETAHEQMQVVERKLQAGVPCDRTAAEKCRWKLYKPFLYPYQKNYAIWCPYLEEWTACFVQHGCCDARLEAEINWYAGRPFNCGTMTCATSTAAPAASWTRSLLALTAAIAMACLNF